jgi:hypothetical protein
MGEPRVLGQVESYAAVHELLRARADELGLSREVIDELAGVQPGYSAKLLSPVPIRRASLETLLLLIQALGLGLVVVEDRAALERLRDRAQPRSRVGGASLMHSGTVQFKFSRRHFRRIGRKGGRNSRKGMGPEEASRLGRRAALARWSAGKGVAPPVR